MGNFLDRALILVKGVGSSRTFVALDPSLVTTASELPAHSDISPCAAAALY